MSDTPAFTRIAPQSGVAFRLRTGERLRVVDPQGEQVADLAAFGAEDTREYFSSGRTLDYGGSIYLTTGGLLYSNRSRPMLRIVRDDIGRHDYLLTPCSRRMFEILQNEHDHPNCHDNLALALRPFGIGEDDIHCAFNAFMNVEIDGEGRTTVRSPKSRPGDAIVFEAQMDLIVGLTACSSESSNAGRCKPIDYRIEGLASVFPGA